MSKSIKLQQSVYRALMEIQAKRETYSDTVTRLIHYTRLLDDLVREVTRDPEKNPPRSAKRREDEHL